MSSKTVLMAAGVWTVGCFLSAAAETLTWTGNAGDNLVTTAENWSPVKTPAMGDRLVSSVDGLCFASETVGLSGEGLTFAPTKKVYFGNTFSGDGPLTIDASNVELCLSNAFTHTGGTTINNGTVKICTKDVSAGKGGLTLNQKNATRPYLKDGAWAPKLTSDIVLRGAAGISGSWVVLSEVQNMTIDGSITADCDFTLRNTNRGSVITGGISAPGKTVTFENNNETTSSYPLTVKGAIDASVVVKAYKAEMASQRHYVQFEGLCTGIDNSLTVESGTNILTSAASWEGTNVVVKGGGMLYLKGDANLAANAQLRLEEGAFVRIDSGVIAHVGKLTIGDLEMLPGCYSSLTLPGVFSGAGCLAVGVSPVVWTGETGGSWNEAANWNPARVPGKDDVAIFTANMTVASDAAPDEVTVPANETRRIYIGSGVTVISYVAFKGAGAMWISGNGYTQKVPCSDLSGPIDLSLVAGFSVSTPNSTKNPMGVGDITVRAAFVGTKSVFRGLGAVSWNQTFDNDFSLVGQITNKWSGSSKYGGLSISQTTTFNGMIRGDTDVMFESANGVFNLNGAVSVPDGKTICLWNNAQTDNNQYLFNVNSVLTGNLQVRCNRNSVILNPTATCSGTNVVVTGENALLRLTRAGNLSDAATLSLEDGGRVTIDEGVRQQVDRLVIDGIEQPRGTYTKERCDRIAGAGKLRVGNFGFAIIYR